MPTKIGLPTQIPAAILGAGIGGLAIKIPYSFGADGSIEKYIEITSIATALIVGIITNAVLTKVEKSKLGKEK